MVAEDLLFWLAPLNADHQAPIAVLCRRHADAMVLPRGWVLDDRREAVPRLFRSQPASIDSEDHTGRPRRRRSEPRSPDDSGGIQLSLTESDPPSRPVSNSPSRPLSSDDGSVEEPDTTPDTAPADVDDSSGPITALWSPLDEDLDDVLPQVDSPLLARAFRGVVRQRP